MKLRRWQQEAIPRVESAGYRGMVRAVMGAGKSVCMAELIRRAPSDWRVVVSAPTIKLVRQLSGTLRDIVGEPVGQVYTHAHHVERITVCCHPSLERLPWDLTPDLWIADEAHRTESPEVLAWDAFAGATRKLGFSATPWGKPLTLYEDLLYNYSARDALKDGVVVPWRIVHPQVEGDADEACWDMIRRMEGPGVVNATSIKDAEHYADWLTRRGIPAMPVHSAIPDGGARSIERLEAGELRCVVHVNMLAEGVDLPWLRWLCLRRPTSNPVRFAQEVGRALRAHPGKSVASILDPHDLFGQFRLDEEAMLGGGPDKETKAKSQPDVIAQEMRLDLDLWTPQVIPVEGIPRVRSYLRRIVTAMDAAGLVESKVASRHWRERPASAKQLAWVEKMRFSRAPQPHRDVLCRIAERPGGLTRGDVSDLITVFTGLKRGWPDFDGLYS